MSVLKNALLTFAVSVLPLFSAGAAAQPLHDFGLIVLDDMQVSHLHLHSNAYIGGDVTASTLDANGAVIRAGGQAAIGNLNCNGGQQACLSFGADIAAQRTVIAESLYETAVLLATLEANGNIESAHGQARFVYTGTDPVAIFEIDGAALFAPNNNWSLAAGAADTVIINVSGSDLRNPGSVNFNFSGSSGTGSIVWNFHEATSLNFGAARFTGAVLAPWADLHFGNGIDGAVAVASLSGGGSLNGARFAGLPPVAATPDEPSAVPEPATLALFAMGLGAILLARQWRRRPAR